MTERADLPSTRKDFSWCAQSGASTLRSGPNGGLPQNPAMMAVGGGRRMTDTPRHWAASVVDAILEIRNPPEQTRALLRSDMQDIIEIRVLKALEAELTWYGKWRYKRVKPEKRLEFLMAKVPNSLLVFDKAVQSFIMDFSIQTPL